MKGGWRWAVGVRLHFNPLLIYCACACSASVSVCVWPCVCRGDESRRSNVASGARARESGGLQAEKGEQIKVMKISFRVEGKERKFEGLKWMLLSHGDDMRRRPVERKCVTDGSMCAPSFSLFQSLIVRKSFSCCVLFLPRVPRTYAHTHVPGLFLSQAGGRAFFNGHVLPSCSKWITMAPPAINR
jgi:hypothetical protein